MATESVLTFQLPARLSEHFSIPPDTATWKGPVGSYNRCFDLKGKDIGFTPSRECASFGSLTQSLRPQTSTGTSLHKASGVYLLMFDLPSPALYVGIAASSSKTPDGVLSRIRKHRVKLTSSHLGKSSTTNGGVKHTGGWREYAIRRAKFFSNQGTPDCASDARFAIGNFVPSGGPSSHKSEAEWFEGQLTSSERLRDHLIGLLWPGKRSVDVFLLTTGSNSGQRPRTPSVRFWDGSLVSF